MRIEEELKLSNHKNMLMKMYQEKDSIQQLVDHRENSQITIFSNCK